MNMGDVSKLIKGTLAFGPLVVKNKLHAFCGRRVKAEQLSSIYGNDERRANDVYMQFPSTGLKYKHLNNRFTIVDHGKTKTCFGRMCFDSSF